jgi:hypothetical protein
MRRRGGSNGGGKNGGDDRQWQVAPVTSDGGGEVLQLEEATGCEEGLTMADDDGRREGSPCRG